MSSLIEAPPTRQVITINNLARVWQCPLPQSLLQHNYRTSAHNQAYRQVQHYCIKIQAAPSPLSGQAKLGSAVSRSSTMHACED